MMDEVNLKEKVLDNLIIICSKSYIPNQLLMAFTSCCVNNEMSIDNVDLSISFTSTTKAAQAIINTIRKITANCNEDDSVK